MNNLFNFYFPKFIRNTLKVFGGCLLLVVLAKLIPDYDEDVIFLKNTVISIVIYLILPVMLFLRTEVYLPFSLNWLLLTPTRKKDLFIFNGLFNLLKFFIILALGHILILISEGFVWENLSLYEMFFMKRSYIPSPYDGIHIKTVVLIFYVVVIVLGASFTMFPKNTQVVSKVAESARLKLSFFDKLKLLFSFLIGGLVIVIGFYITAHFIPNAIAYAFGLSLIIYFVLSMSQETLKLYYSRKKINLVFCIVFSVLSLFFVSYSRYSITSEKFNIDRKVEALRNLEPWSFGADKIIMDELMKGNQHLSSLSRSDLKSFFIDENRHTETNQMLSHWSKLCLERKDYTCWLTTVLKSLKEKKPYVLDYVRTSCPKDIDSCYMILTHKEAKDEERRLAFDTLSNRCDGRVEYYEFETCKSYYKYISEHKKKKP